MTREERENAIKVIKNYDLNFHKINGLLFKAEEIASAFDCALEALEQEPKTDVPDMNVGRWIPVTNGRGGHECDQCHEYAPSYQNGEEYLSKYCPKCGIRMKKWGII